VSSSRSLGDILVELGKLTAADAERALVHQQEEGGYFGEALVALGIASQGEIEWALASQYDLPYVFPDPEAIDPSAAALVAPEWALAHLTLPIMRSGDELTVVVDSPFRLEAAEELAGRVGCEARLALAAPGMIRDAIRAVYGREAEGVDPQETLPCGLDEALARIDLAGAERFGISVREGRGGGWWDAGGTVHRRALDFRWGSVLAERLDSPLPSGASGPFEARLSLGGPALPVEVRLLEGDGGREILFRLVHDPHAAAHRFTPPPAGLLAEIRLLVRSGAARLLVTGSPAELAEEVLPHLPTLFFDGGRRSAHLRDRGRHEGAGLGIRVPVDPEGRRGSLDALRPFQLDVVTVALRGLDATSLRKALDAASVCFVFWGDPQDTGVPAEAGVRWRLHLAREDGDHLEWALHTLGR
jgi:hypothetical protein